LLYCALIDSVSVLISTAHFARIVLCLAETAIVTPVENLDLLAAVSDRAENVKIGITCQVVELIEILLQVTDA